MIYDKLINRDTQNQVKTCQELWSKCKMICSSINPLERIKYDENGCCVMSPIPTNTDHFKPIFEPLFSKRTPFTYNRYMIEVVI